ncbi:unnamed protein product [Paramecium octaurelia]|uniref:Uncharacterized protein n=1 Tax=Paramecium octaurelia TaxID=43137 RepID=A0A8S1W5M2_PAROT|nr:unnamed protein product [Paramecium octaurelia]
MGKLILIIEYLEQNKKWIVIQNIEVDFLGQRLCFINDNLFTFQPSDGNLMYVYEMNSVSSEFMKTNILMQIKLLVSKHENYINLIRRIDNDKFQIDKDLYGQISHDGWYLITWDNISKEIQIRRCILYMKFQK